MSNKPDAARSRTATTRPGGPPATVSRLLPGYLAVQVLLLPGTIILPRPGNVIAAGLLSALAWVALFTGVRRFQPQPGRPWRLLLIALALAGGSNLAFALVFLYPGLMDWLPVANLMRISRYVIVAVALGLLARGRDRRTGLSDLLDAGIGALGVFLVLWSGVIQPSLARRNGQPVQWQIVTEVASLVVLAMVLKVVYAGAARTRATQLMLAGVLGTTMSPLAAVLVYRNLPVALLITQLVTLGGMIVFGAAGLTPSLAGSSAPSPRTSGLSRRRALLFACLALIGPAIWLQRVPVEDNLDLIGQVTPIIASALLALLLVARLALVADTAQLRAQELAAQTVQLHEAVRQQEALQRQLTHRATHDPLTGLANRLVLVERIERALDLPGTARRGALLLLDMDGFKEINDTYGHPAGDEALIEVARRLGAAVPEHATLARLGGDEFAVYLDDTTAETARACAEAIRRQMVEVLPVAGHEVALSTSIGVFLAAGADGPLTPATALRDADLALYAAKDSGKNRVVVFTRELRAARVDRSRITAALLRPPESNDFELHYQPIVALPGQDVVAVEALLRWAPDGKPVPPATFIPIAEDIAAIKPIGAWALRRACTEAAAWYRDHGVSVAVNLSGRQLDDPGLADLVGTALAEAGLPPCGLILELTETAMVSLTGTTAAKTLRTLRDQGIRIAVDDFGTGYSSLAYVSRLPVDILKLDRFLVPTSVEVPEGDGWAFTRAVLHLVDDLGMVPVAEAVETTEQVTVLRRLGCPYAQGHAFGAPVPAAAVTARLRTAPRRPSRPLATTG